MTPRLRPQSRSNPRGASLLEAMIALAVMAFGLSGFTVAMIASARVDRANTARAAAKEVAQELASEISTWSFADTRLAPNSYTPAEFAAPKASGGTVTFGTGTAASKITGETLSPAAPFGEADLTATNFRGRSLAALNSTEPGRTYVFNRYWYVVTDASNAKLKIIAVHVTYGRSPDRRDVVTTFTSVMDEAALANSAFTGY